MPSPEQILAGLEEISSQWRALAVFWHAYFGVLVLALIARANLGMRVLGALLALPLFSVSALAWASGNPFNGSFFALLGISLIAIALTLPRDRARIAPFWGLASGSLMFLFGWVYPHFLDTPSMLSYLHAAPTGLIPCPTLAIVTGFSLVLDGLGSRAWSLTLGMAGIFYGVFGAARLGVTIDWVLAFGALVTLVAVFVNKKKSLPRRAAG